MIIRSLRAESLRKETNVRWLLGGFWVAFGVAVGVAVGVSDIDLGLIVERA